jgi:hypothetical protein
MKSRQFEWNHSRPAVFMLDSNGFRIRFRYVGYSVTDPDPRSGAFLTPGSGMVKKPGSGMNHPDHISESLKKQCFGLKYLNSLMWIRDLRWKRIQIRDGKRSDPG